MAHSGSRDADSYRRVFDELLTSLAEACGAVYGDRLVSLAVFGSVGRDRPRPDSDIDLFLVAQPLPNGHLPRMDEFSRVEERLGPHLERAKREGVDTRFSPIIRSPEEMAAAGPPFIDMVLDVRVLSDRDAFFSGLLERFKAKLSESGAVRVSNRGPAHWRVRPASGGGGHDREP